MGFFDILLLALGAAAISMALVVGICLLLGRKKTKKDLKKRTDASGKRGEEELQADVKRFTRFRHTRVLYNLYLGDPGGRSTEIDLLLLDRDGVFIFESKNYNGMIFGEEQNRNWLHVLRNGDRFHFYNPIWQNSGHVTAVRKALGNPDRACFKSIIVFGKNCIFKRLKVRQSDCMVVKAGRTRKAFRILGRRTPNILSKRQIEEYYKLLLPYAKASRRTKRQHLKQVRKKH